MDAEVLGVLERSQLIEWMAYANIRGGLHTDPERRELLAALHTLRQLQALGDGQTELADLLPFDELDGTDSTPEWTPPTDDEEEANARAMLAQIRNYAGRLDAGGM